MNGLILHAGANAATREQVALAPVPLATRTWTPVGHGALVDGVQTTLERSGLSVVNEAHGLTNDGARYFGLLQVRATGTDDGDFGLVVGLRNSHDKRFPAGLAVGASVFVCDNLSFSGEIKLARKHTVHISRDLPQLIERAVGRLGDLRRTQDERFLAYHQSELSDSAAHDIIIRAVDDGVLPVTRIPQVLTEWREPRHPEFRAAGRTGWRLFNAFTEALKGNLDALPRRTQALHGLMDLACGVNLIGAAREPDIAIAI